MDQLIKTLKDFLTPFSWRKLISVCVVLVALAVAVALVGCHVSRECRSTTVVNVHRTDTIDYNSRYHKDHKNYNYIKLH